MRNNVLVPLKRSTNCNSEGPAEKMRFRLERHTKYWPITISSTLMFNLKQVYISNFMINFCLILMFSNDIIIIYLYNLVNRSITRFDGKGRAYCR